jgi:uncharacterized protein YbjT (DUF2867 family)
MRVLVTGAGGYVGGRLVPVLLDRGHEVVATYSRALPDAPERGRPRTGPWWLDRVETRLMDVLDPEQVKDAVADVDAVFYLVHGMGGPDFRARDAEGARTMAEASSAAGVERIVYLSGLIPPIDESRLSEHLASRLEVERLLGSTGVPTLTLRAAIVLGSGSTSFEVVRQVSERMPLQTVPAWMRSTVQPIAVVDVLEAMANALDARAESRWFDVGGPEQLRYSALLRMYADVARLVRPQLPLLGAPRQVVGRVTGLLTGAPSSTVAALVESLPHDMVCTDDSFREALLPDGYRLLGVRESLTRALTRPRAGTRPQDRDPMGPLPGDPDWAGGDVYLFDGRARRRPRSRLAGLLLGVPRPGRSPDVIPTGPQGDLSV